jgi:hypothetical protein
VSFLLFVIIGRVGVVSRGKRGICGKAKKGFRLQTSGFRFRNQVSGFRLKALGFGPVV